MFSDVSELEKLRASELRLAAEIEAKHEELREAYLHLEERNRTLDAALKRVQVIRGVASVCVLALIAGLGVYLWDGVPGLARASKPPPPRNPRSDSPGSRWSRGAYSPPSPSPESSRRGARSG